METTISIEKTFEHSEQVQNASFKGKIGSGDFTLSVLAKDENEGLEIAIRILEDKLKQLKATGSEHKKLYW